MFVLSVIEDKIKVDPDKFDRNITEVLIEQIEIKFVNKVLVDVGLCVCFYDFIDVGDPYVYPAEGSAHQRVKFRMVVFRPFIGEIIVGKIAACREDGIRGNDQRFTSVPPQLAVNAAPSEYVPRRKCWIWRFDEDDESGGIEFPMQAGDKIRFRVRTIDFTSLTTTAKGITATTTSEMKSNTNDDIDDTPLPGVRRRSTSIDLGKDAEVPSAMRIMGCVNEDGLGVTSWWE